MMNEATKKQLIEAFKNIDVKDMYASEDENKRKWFRFGAFDALRIACELVIAMPTTEEKEKK